MCNLTGCKDTTNNSKFKIKNSKISTKKRKIAPRDDFSDCCDSGALAVVGGIVLLPADLPEVGGHGLFAGGEVLLGDEVQLVLRDLVQIFPAGCYHRAHLGEALAVSQLSGGRLGAAVVLAYHVDTRADGVGRRRHTVGSQERIAVVAVLSTFLRTARQKAGHIVDTFCPFYFCHSRSAIGVQRFIPLR